MAHFARIENGIVTQVIVVSNNDAPGDFPESEFIGAQFCSNLLGGEWKQTSYNANFRIHYAGIGYAYSEELDAFIPQSPYPSWILDTEKLDWFPPIEYPDLNKLYTWDEDSLSWIETE